MCGSKIYVVRWEYTQIFDTDDRGSGPYVVVT